MAAEPLSEQVRRIRRRVRRGTYKYGPDEIAQARRRLKAFERIEQPTELQKKEKYRLQAILEGKAPALTRDVGAARRGLFGGSPGPQAVVQGMALAAAPAAPGFIAASIKARGVLSTAIRLGTGALLASGRMRGEEKPPLRFPSPVEAVRGGYQVEIGINAPRARPETIREEVARFRRRRD